MRYIPVDDIMFIHDFILDKSGGLSGVRDQKLLQSIAHKPRTHLFGLERHKTVFNKAAALLEAIAVFHPFTDGNKRTAMAAAGYFLFRNGYDTTFTNEEYETFMLHVVHNKPSQKSISKWLKEHSKEISRG